MIFSKYHALGNDYLILEPHECPQPPTEAFISFVCDRHKGLGSDGILYGPTYQMDSTFGLRIFNPDGSEAEKSGNGLRIFARYLWDHHYITGQTCILDIQSAMANCSIINAGESIEVEMGPVLIEDKPYPIDRSISINDTTDQLIHFYKASVGNPHCIVPVKKTSATLAKTIGPLLEGHFAFPSKTNVQFLEILDRRNIKIEIWERGAGYTLASGSSSCAAASVAFKLGLCDQLITVYMPGGQLKVQLDNHLHARLQGPAEPIAKMELLAPPTFNLLGSAA